jgi:uncharacterized UBP type Zn finger protein
MATPFKIQVESQNSGLLELKQGQDEASKVTDLLQKDLEVFNSLQSVYLKANITQNHHVFFNESGFHDHVNFVGFLLNTSLTVFSSSIKFSPYTALARQQRL